MPYGFVTLDAYVSRKSFTLNAWVIGGRHRHHRTLDHFGADSDLYITLDEAVGPWGGGTPIKYVIADLYARITALSSSTHYVRVAYLNAVVLAPGGSVETSAGTFRAIFWLDAIAKRAASSSFTLSALITRGGSMTLDAYVQTVGHFYLNAFVV